MNKKVLKIIIGVLLVGSVSAGGYYGYKNYASKKVVTSSKSITAKVKKSNLEISVQATGTITSVTSVSVSSQNTGTLTNLSFKEGDSIKKGDLICKINDSNGAQGVSTAQNSVSQKSLELSNLERNLDNLYIKAPIDGVVKSVFVSPGDDVATAKQAYGALAIIVVNDALEVPIPFPQSGKISSVNISAGASVKKGDVLFKLDDSDVKNNIAAKQLEVQQAQNDLSFKQSNLDKSTIVSPIDGIISALSFKEGDSIENNKLIATIIDPTQMQVVLPVDELDIDKVKVGQKTTINIDAIKGKTYEGTVEKISQTGKTTNNVTTFDVTVSIVNPEGVKPGMNVNATIAVENKENVLTIPVEALIERNGKHYVMTPSTGGTNKPSDKASKVDGNSSSGNQGNTPKDSQSSTNQYRKSNTTSNSNVGQGKLTEVTIGLQNQNSVEILTGVKEGDSVLITLPQTTNKTNSNTQNGFGQGGMQRGASGGAGAAGAAGKRN